MIEGATNYVTASPCWNCFKQIANAGVTRIVYGEFYRDERIFDIAQKIGIELVHVPLPGVTLPKLAAAGAGLSLTLSSDHQDRRVQVSEVCFGRFRDRLS